MPVKDAKNTAASSVAILDEDCVLILPLERAVTDVSQASCLQASDRDNGSRQTRGDACRLAGALPAGVDAATIEQAEPEN